MNAMLSILRYSRSGEPQPVDPLDADEWRRWAARMLSEATREVGTPVLDGVPKSKSEAEQRGDLLRWQVCRAGHLRARKRAKRVALVLAHDAITRAQSDPSDALWPRLAEQYQRLYLDLPGEHPAEDEELAEVAEYLRTSQECAARSMSR